MDKPKISVIMPFYNCEKYLDESIQSILNQTFSDFEFIIINDASTDHSDEVVKKYLQDERITYITNKKNKGPVYNFNHGIEMAKANIVARMDGDDVSDIKRLKKQYDYLNKNKSDLVGCNVYLMNEKRKIFDKLKKPETTSDIKKYIFKFCPMLNGCLMGRKNIFKKTKYRQKYLLCNDHDLVFRLIFNDYRLHNLDEYLYYYRIHNQGMLSRYPVKQARAVYKLKKEMAAKHKVKLSFEDYFIMVADLLLSFFPGRFRLFCMSTYKKLFYS